MPAPQRYGVFHRESRAGANAAYSKWLAENGYEAQYQAYLKAHNGSNEGFVYKDPGDMPEGWGQ
jgi:hypothetical protein